jgi:Cysteine-rich CPCC
VEYVLFYGGKMAEADAKKSDPERLNAHNQTAQQWFQQMIDDMDKRSVFASPQQEVRYRCPCCHYKTLQERGGYDICSACYWGMSIVQAGRDESKKTGGYYYTGVPCVMVFDR